MNIIFSEIYPLDFFSLTAIPYQNMPELKTIENCMKVSQMLIQAMESNASPFLQLPHITKDMLKHFPTEKVHACSNTLNHFTSKKVNAKGKCMLKYT